MELLVRRAFVELVFTPAYDKIKMTQIDTYSLDSGIQCI